MALSERDIEEFRTLYSGEFGKTIGIDEARAMASRLITLYELLLRPLPERQDPLSD